MSFLKKKRKNESTENILKETLRTMRNIHRDSRKQVKSSGTAMRTVPTEEQTKKSAETIHVLAEVERNIKTAVEDKFIFLTG